MEATSSKGAANISCSTNATPLGGRQRLQHHEHRRTYGVGKQRLALGIESAGRPARSNDRSAVYPDGVRLMVPQELFAPRLSGSQHVQADPRHDRREPSAQVLYAARIRSAEPQPGFLHGIVRFAGGAEHTVGNRPQAGPFSSNFFPSQSCSAIQMTNETNSV